LDALTGFESVFDQRIGEDKCSRTNDHCGDSRNVRSRRTSFLSVFVVEVQKYPFSFGVGVIMMIAIVLGVPGQIIFGHFSDMHRTASLAVNTAGQSPSIIFYLYTLSNPIIAVTCLALFGFFTYSCYPVFLSAVSDSVPPRFLSLSNAIVWGVGILGGNSVGPLIVGLAVGTNLSLLPTIFLTLAIVSGLSTTLAVFLPRRSRAVHML
jgi:sugar phosphate permease